MSQFTTSLGLVHPRWVNQDMTRVRQVVANLLSNAAKFTKDGYIEIYVGYNPQKNNFEIIVSDTGIGIKQGQHKSLFLPFVQADKSIHKEFGGTGLGLVISKKISKLMGGNLIFDPLYSQGAKFIFSFPRRSTDLDEERAQELWDLPTCNSNKSQSQRQLLYQLVIYLAKITSAQLSLLGFQQSNSSHIDSLEKGSVFPKLGNFYQGSSVLSSILTESFY